MCRTPWSQENKIYIKKICVSCSPRSPTPLCVESNSALIMIPRSLALRCHAHCMLTLWSNVLIISNKLPNCLNLFVRVPDGSNHAKIKGNFFCDMLLLIIWFPKKKLSTQSWASQLLFLTAIIPLLFFVFVFLLNKHVHLSYTASLFSKLPPLLNKPALLYYCIPLYCFQNYRLCWISLLCSSLLLPPPILFSKLPAMLNKHVHLSYTASPYIVFKTTGYVE